MTQTTPNAVLDGMLALLAEPEAWIQRELAGIRTETGSFRATNETNLHADCFCLVGARCRVIIEAETGNARSLDVRRAVNDRILAAIKTLFPDRHTGIGRFNLPHFNDHPETTHADVIQVLRLARALRS